MKDWCRDTRDRNRLAQAPDLAVGLEQQKDHLFRTRQGCKTSQEPVHGMGPQLPYLPDWIRDIVICGGFGHGGGHLAVLIICLKYTRNTIEI
jgi:hypothetical protein